MLPKQSARLALVNDVNFVLYTPFLPEAAAGLLEPRHVVTPLQEILDRTYLRLGAVTAHDPVARTLERSHRGTEEPLRPVRHRRRLCLPDPARPGLDEHAIGFKSLADAIWLRNHVVETLEEASATEDPTRRERLLPTSSSAAATPASRRSPAGLRRGRDGQLSARQAARDALDPRRGDAAGPA